MKYPRSGSPALSTLLRAAASCLLLAPALTGVAHAVVNVQTLTPAANSEYTLTETARPERLLGAPTRSSEYRRFFLGLNYNFLNDPLVELDPTRSYRVRTILENIQTFDLTAGIEINAFASFNATVPLNIVRPIGGASQFALGDVRVFPKFFLVRDPNAVNVALIPEITFPTGDAALFTTSTAATYGLLVALEKEFGRVNTALNVGYRRSPGATFEDIDYRQRIPLTLGAAIPIGPRWSVNGEAAAQLVVPFNRYQNPSELYGGLKYRVSNEMVVTGGASVGAATNRSSSADYRLLAGLKFAPVASEASEAPIHVTQARVVFTPTEIRIGEEVKFHHDSDVLTDRAKDILSEVADVMKQNYDKFKMIQIEGHTNELGTDGYNLDLSRRRAASVREYLSSQGVRPDTLAPIGYGERRPKELSARLSRPARLTVNRRVEFKVLQ